MLYCWSRLVLPFVVLSFQVLLEHATVWDVVEVVPGEVEVLGSLTLATLVRPSVVGLVGRRLVLLSERVLLVVGLVRGSLVGSDLVDRLDHS